MGRVRFVACAVLVAGLAIHFAHGQSQAVRDPLAIAAVQKAIAALGGITNIGLISDCKAQGSFTSSSNPAATGTFTWQTAGSEFNYTTHMDTVDRTLLSGHGTPADLRNGPSWHCACLGIHDLPLNSDIPDLSP